MTATVAVDVCTRPLESVEGTRCTRCTPDSYLSLLYTRSPVTCSMEVGQNVLSQPDSQLSLLCMRSPVTCLVRSGTRNQGQGRGALHQPTRLNAC
jgi:hypothetical protein